MYAMSSASSDSDDDDDDNGVLPIDKANDLVARFVKKAEMDSDIEDVDDRNDLPDAKAWGWYLRLMSLNAYIWISIE